MRIVDTLSWRGITRWLERYCRRQPDVRHCFIRHSTALGAESALLSDYDLAFFVDAGNFEEVGAHAIRIRHDLRRALVLDSIVLPATGATYRLCAGYYAHRSLYPMRSWRRVSGAPLALPERPYSPPPLDHSPEGFLYGYLVPVLLGKKRRHPFERALMRRKLEREALQFDGDPPQRPAAGFHDAVAAQIRSWDRFYGRLATPVAGERIAVRPSRRRICDAFAARWDHSGARGTDWRAVDSIWVYPAFNNDTVANVALNFDPSVGAADCRRGIDELLRTFRDLEFNLLPGTERSMLGRLGGLSRVSLLEPWLAKTFGRCLYGDPHLKERIPEPSMREVEEKLQEYFLYLSYRVFPSARPFAIYRLCFTMDHLRRQRELVLDDEDLADIYGREFLPEARFRSQDGKRQLPIVWKRLHGLDPWSET